MINRQFRDNYSYFIMIRNFFHLSKCINLSQISTVVRFTAHNSKVGIHKQNPCPREMRILIHSRDDHWNISVTPRKEGCLFPMVLVSILPCADRAEWPSGGRTPLYHGQTNDCGALNEAKPIIMLMVVVLITLFSIAFIVLIMKLAYSEGFSTSRFIRLIG